MKRQDYSIAEYSREMEAERLGASFADFLILSEISGGQRSLSKSSIISGDNIEATKSRIEIIKEDKLPDESEHGPITILLHRDDSDDVRRIEVICACGKRADINLEYAGDSDQLILPALHAENETTD